VKSIWISMPNPLTESPENDCVMNGLNVFSNTRRGNMMKQWIYLISMTCILPMVLTACTHLEKPVQIVGKTGVYFDWGKHPPEARDRAKHIIEGKRPFEWWYFDGHLDTGEYFVGVFLDPSFTTSRPGVAFTLYGTNWSKRPYLKDLNHDQMRASTADTDIVCPYGFAKRINKKTYKAGWDMDGLHAELTFTTLAPGWRPTGGDGVNEDHLDFFWAVHQARNRIAGTITENGVTRKVTGIGYADHNWGKKSLADITRYWVWGRILAGRYTLVYADVDYIDSAITSRPLYIARDNTIIVGTGSPTIIQSDFATHPVLKRHYPKKIAIDYSYQGIETHVTIRQKAVVEDVDLLTVSGFNRLTRWIVRTFFARPTYFRIIADYDGTIIENGRSVSISGECLYEVMGLQ